MTNIINQEAWLPAFNSNQEHTYILLTSLNLGGAEKIVSDQLWANYYQKNSHKVTLIVIYDKNKEHSIPPNVNIVRLNNNVKNGELLFKQISYSNTPMVCHLINDKISNYLFSLGLNIHLVIHNDKRGWSNTEEVLNHPQVISLISVCNYVTKQLRLVSDKPVFTVRHQISYKHFQFNEKTREEYRNASSFKENDIVVGMTGRICLQKNYFLALDVIAYLSRKNPNYKLVILGGFQKDYMPVYFDLINKANKLKVQRNVRLPGFKDDAVKWLNTFDVGLNVSHFEGLSMATQEFMMNGLQMVASRVSGQPEILDNNKQLHFFDIEEDLNDIETSKVFSIDTDIDSLNEQDADKFSRYMDLVKTVAQLIENNHSNRVTFGEDDKFNINRITYGSHNLWSLFNFIPNKKRNEEIKPAFLTSNLNLGGAQRSLVNLLCEMKKQDTEIPLILLNQSNYAGFYKTILDEKINHYLCHSNNDVFVISANLIKYIFDNEINRIVLWNVDSKIKLIVTKLLSHYVDIIDVSPGDYCFAEMDNQKDFQDAIYTDKIEYFKTIHKFVSKFDNTHLDQEYKQYLKNDTVIIPNGVPIDTQYIKENIKNKKFFNFLVCGRITESKHIDLILEAFDKLYASVKNIHMDFYGSVEPYNTEYYDMLCEKYSHLISCGAISFKGNIDDPKTIMKEYDSIIILGTHQGSPNMVLESAACKLPCISNDSGGTREIITNDKTGLLLPENMNVEDVYQAMLKTLYHYDHIVDMAENAFVHITENFSMRTMYDKYMKVIFD